jgi:glycosyltransferase involved in cell wall biosynthesis
MLTLATGLADRYDVTMVASPAARQPLLVRARAAGVAVKVLGSETAAEREELSGWLVRAGMEVFHDHAGIGWEGIEAIEAAHAAEIPVVIRTEHLPYLLTDEVQVARHRRMLRMLHALITVSAGARESMLAAGVPALLMHVVRNGVPAPSRETSPADRAVVRAAVRAEHGIPVTARIVLNVGRLTPQKAQDVLLDAMSLLTGTTDDTWLLVVGDGPELPTLAAQVRALDIGDHVRLLGCREDVWRLLQAADVFVLPSRFEGLPLAALEAMAARLPVVATRVTGCDEAVQHGRTGLLVPVEDPAALAEAMAAVLGDRLLTRQLGEAGYAAVRRDFSAARMVDETAAVYERLLAPWDARRTRAGGTAPLEETPGH